MKKFLAIILALCIILSVNAFTAFATEDDSALTANYATTKPVIDGTIDDVWNTTQPIDTIFDVMESYAHGYAKILWTEDTLYLLADITDSTTNVGIDNTANQACFWVSETRSSNESFSDSAEDWNISVNQSGTYDYYSGINLEGKASWAAKLTNKGYVVEIAVPRQGRSSNYNANDKIGFGFSVEDDTSTDDERDNVCASLDTRYWSNPSVLAEITLIKNSIAETTPNSTATQNNTSTPSNTATPDNNVTPSITDNQDNDVTPGNSVIPGNNDATIGDNTTNGSVDNTPNNTPVPQANNDVIIFIIICSLLGAVIIGLIVFVYIRKKRNK